MKRILAFGALAALGTIGAGCGGGDGLVHLRGHVYNADGTPAAGLWLVSGALIADDGVLAAQTKTDAEGAYDLVGTLTTHAIPATAHIDLMVGSDDLSESYIFASVRHASDAIDVPDLKLWDDGLTLTARPEGGVALTWKQPPAGFEPIELFAGDHDDEGEGGFVESWRTQVTSAPFDLPAEALEDRAASIVLLAGNPLGQSCAQDLCITLRSHQVSTSGPGTLPPVSRGAACTATAQDGATSVLASADAAACPLTDGVFRNFQVPLPDWTCGESACPLLGAVTIDLGADTSFDKVVVRDLEVGVGAFLDIEASSDGTSFTQLHRVFAPIVESYLDVVLDAPTSARFVRLSAPSGSILTAAEVSVF
jgi:hypothetical protein